MRHEKKKNQGWKWAIVFLFIMTTLGTTTTLSKYATTEAGTDTAIVASVAVDVSSADLTIGDIYPGENKALEFKVVNYSGMPGLEQISDVSQAYTIELLGTDNLPLIYTLSSATVLDAVGTTITTPLVLGKDIPTVEKGLLPAGIKAEHTYTLTVTWNNTSGQQDSDYSGLLDHIKLRVHSEQEKPIE